MAFQTPVAVKGDSLSGVGKLMWVVAGDAAKPAPAHLIATTLAHLLDLPDGRATAEGIGRRGR